MALGEDIWFLLITRMAEAVPGIMGSDASVHVGLHEAPPHGR